MAKQTQTNSVTNGIDATQAPVMPPLDSVPLDVYMDEASSIPDENTEDFSETVFLDSVIDTPPAYSLVNEIRNPSQPAKVTKQVNADERLFIGALLTEMEVSELAISDLVLRLRHEWFKQPQCQAIFVVIRHLLQSNKLVNGSSISLFTQVKKAYERIAKGELEDFIIHDVDSMQKEWLKQAKELDVLRKRSLIQSLIDVIQDRYKQSMLVTFSKSLPQLLRQDMPDGKKLVEIKHTIELLSERFEYTNNHKSLASVAQALLERSVQLSESDDPDRIVGLSSGYKVIDEQLNGFEDGKYYILAARPSMGKTTFLLNLLLNMARKGIKVAFFSYEMNKEQVVAKLLAIISGINGKRLKTGDLSADEWIKYEKSITELSSLPIEVYDVMELGTNDVMVMLDRCRTLKKEGKLDIVMLDYVQLLKNSKEKSSETTAVLSSVSNAIQFESRSLNTPFFVIAQLSRKVDDRKDKRPQMSDLKGSGSLEQDADSIMFLDRPDYYEQDEVVINSTVIVSVIFAKNREGQIGYSVSLQANLSVGLFSNLPPIEMLKNNNKADNSEDANSSDKKDVAKSDVKKSEVKSKPLPKAPPSQAIEDEENTGDEPPF